MKNARLELAFVFAGLAAWSAAATAYVFRSGWTLYYGDAEAHLNIARRIVDSRSPGYDQIGTVWLPLPHLLMLPFVQNDHLWRSGLAGALPASACFVCAGAFLFAAMRRATGSAAAAAVSLGLFALNPNLLYLQATPMTEPVFLAALMLLLYATVVFAQTQSFAAVVGAGIAALAATLARYEGWFLIPFVTLFFLIAARRRRIAAALVFGAIASLGPLYWLAHNWWLYSNLLEFFNGPYSAENIYRRALAQHMLPYPGDHDWLKAWQYFSVAAGGVAGWGLVAAAAAGLVAIARQRLFWPVALASLPPLFYIWSMHSGGTPIFIHGLWPYTDYNTRYALSALPLFAIAGGSLVLLAGQSLRPWLAVAVLALATVPWLLHPDPAGWICWNEARTNSVGRRAWTQEAAAVMQSSYRMGDGILTSFGDMTGILRAAGIPLREMLFNDEPAWMFAVARPALFLHEAWAIAISGDPVATAIQRATLQNGPRYHLVQSIMLRGAPVIEIYRRD
ncbi:MAG TPA: glycosyltransferase family 39 protein [Bryobacteraceae bacterium]|nr:glycosyltransferase family 39 protein [Bryobacteraceae bacterium]